MKLVFLGSHRPCVLNCLAVIVDSSPSAHRRYPQHFASTWASCFLQLETRVAGSPTRTLSVRVGCQRFTFRCPILRFLRLTGRVCRQGGPCWGPKNSRGGRFDARSTPASPSVPTKGCPLARSNTISADPSSNPRASWDGLLSMSGSMTTESPVQPWTVQPCSVCRCSSLSAGSIRSSFTGWTGSPAALWDTSTWSTNSGVTMSAMQLSLLPNWDALPGTT